MFIRTDERVQFARLLSFLAQGERIAHECALAQAVLAPQEKMRRFFLKQAQEEALHTKIFKNTVAWLAPRHLSQSALSSMERYQRLIHAAIKQGNLAESLLAGQIILEGLGEVVLHRIQAGLIMRKTGFNGIVRRLLAQEGTHHAFGCNILERAITTGEACPETLRQRSLEYLSLTDEMLFSLGDIFEYFDEDQSVYALDTRHTLPDWLQ